MRDIVQTICYGKIANCSENQHISSGTDKIIWENGWRRGKGKIEHNFEEGMRFTVQLERRETYSFCFALDRKGILLKSLTIFLKIFVFTKVLTKQQGATKQLKSEYEKEFIF